MNTEGLAKIAWGFASRYRVTLLLWLSLLIVGFFTYTTFLKREGFPPINLPIGLIQGTYFVDNPQEVDDDVVQPLTSVIESVDGVKAFTASANDNFYTVFIEFEEDITSAEGIADVTQAVKEKVAIPDAATVNFSEIDPSKFNNEFSLLLAVYESSDSSYAELGKKAEIVASQMQELAAIESSESVPVVEEIVNPFTGKTEQRQTSINTIGIQEEGEIVFYPAVSVGVVRVDGVDDIELSEAVEDGLDMIEAGDEIGEARTTITADSAGQIDQQIQSLEDSLVSGLIAVVIIAFLLISWRAALVIALFIPTVLAISFIGLNLLGYSLNTITLFATILTLGLFVDDATIMVEAIDANRKKAKNHETAIKTAVKRVGIASLAGTLTTILVFSPMLFISGILGTFIKLLPVTVVLALAVSFVVSIVIVPFITRPLILRGKKKKSALDRLSLLVPFEDRLGQFLAELPMIITKNRRKGYMVSSAMIAVSIIAIAGGFLLAGRLPFDIFPSTKDSDVLQANVSFANQSSISKNEKVLEALNKNIVSAVGKNLEYVTYVSADTQSANIEIGLTPYTDREPTSHDIIDDLEASGIKISDAEIKYSQRDAGPPSEDFPFQVRLYARNSTILADAVKDLQDFVSDQSFVVIDEKISVAEVKVSGLESISRSDRGQFVTLAARYDRDNQISPANIELERLVTEEYNSERLAALSLAETALDFDVSQESQDAESFSSVGAGMGIAIVLMYLVLVILFNSYSQPLLILMAIPFSLFGVFFGLTITDNPLSFFVMLGLLGLIGIAVNNSILLTEYANQEKEKGATRHEAIKNAIKDRFRPLVTTTLTTIFALLPLALTDPFWQGLAYTLIFGMISSTTLILISFPYYYLIVERVREYKNKKIPSLR